MYLRLLLFFQLEVVEREYIKEKKASVKDFEVILKKMSLKHHRVDKVK